MNNIYKPEFFRISEADDADRLNQIRKKFNPIITDTFYHQLLELIKLDNPSKVLSEEESKELFPKYYHNTNMYECGMWVYYPWSNRLIHLIEEEHFIRVRTNRNKLKITDSEQSLLSNKTIGIIGLSVGHSVAVTIATERICGHLKLADFDTLDLSNLNRIRSGLHNLGVNKAILTAREIAEIDPYLKVTVFENGYNQEMKDNFFNGKQPLDLLVEVCDSLPVKIESRIEARNKMIPVLMDTNDRGMIDIERFDLEPNRQLFHGLIDESILNNTANLNRGQIIEILMKLVSFENASDRLKLSMSELGKTITTWPQLASSVMLGGGATCHLARRILLKENVYSGRFYIDPDTICN